MSFVYVQSEPRLWTVGFYTPSGKWEPDSDHDSLEAAVRRAAYLNGAPAPSLPAEDESAPAFWLKDIAASLKEQNRLLQEISNTLRSHWGMY